MNVPGRYFLLLAAVVLLSGALASEAGQAPSGAGAAILDLSASAPLSTPLENRQAPPVDSPKQTKAALAPLVWPARPGDPEIVRQFSHRSAAPPGALAPEPPPPPGSGAAEESAGAGAGFGDPESLFRQRGLSSGPEVIPLTLEQPSPSGQDGGGRTDAGAQVKDQPAVVSAEIPNDDAHSTGAGAGGELQLRRTSAQRAFDALRSRTPLGRLAGQVFDASGRLVPARVRVVDQSDTAAQGVLPEGFWCDGQFDVNVLSGPVRVEISRGRFHPLMVRTMQVAPGGRSLERFVINQPAALDFAAQGWHLADLDLALQLQPGETRLWLGPDPSLPDLVRAARAEGVRILGVPAPWAEGAAATDVKYLHAGGGRDVVVIPSFGGPRHPVYGSAYGLGVGSLDGLPAEAVSSRPLYEIFEEIQARGGLAVFKQPGGIENNLLRRQLRLLFPALEQNWDRALNLAPLYCARELPFATVIGPAYDALAFDGSAPMERLWFNLLSAGYKVALVGAAGGSLPGGRLPAGQTFVQVPGPLTAPAVLSALKNSRTVVSFGPAVFCRILERDKGPGETLPADGRMLTLTVQGYASQLPGSFLEKVEIVRNGKVVHTVESFQSEARVTSFNWTISETGPAWYVVRATERYRVGKSEQPGGRAWTSPIYFSNPAFFSPRPAQSRISGTLRTAAGPLAGSVTAISSGQAPRQIQTDQAGNFTLEVPSASTLIFDAPGCEPVPLRVFEHPKVRQALEALHPLAPAPTGNEPLDITDRFSRPALFPAWVFLLAELHWDVVLSQL